MEAHNPDVSICIQHALSPGHIKGKNELQFFPVSTFRVPREERPSTDEMCLHIFQFIREVIHGQSQFTG